MKKAKKIILIFLSVVVVLVGGTLLAYRFALRPVLEKKVEQVAHKINDGSLHKVVDSVASEMIQEGIISEESIPTYNQYASEQVEDKAPEVTTKPLKKKTLMQKLEEAMTAEEFAFAMSLYSRVDINYGMHLLNTDRQAAKEYVYSKATPAEISRALEIYAKYAYILRE